MSRRDPRPSGPSGDDRPERPASVERPWGGGRDTDRSSATIGTESHRPFGGAAWREPRMGAVGAGVRNGDETEGLDGERDDLPGSGPRRRRGEEKPAHPRRSLAALGASVRVVRDERGVPHLSAKSERDAWAALGWCMAEDRRRQLDLLRRLAQGRAAEVLGAGFVAHDALVRTVGIARRAALAASRLPGAAHDVVASFAAGVNAGLAGPVGEDGGIVGVEPWTIADSLSIEILRAFATSLRAWPAKLLIAKAVACAGVGRAEWIAGRRLPEAERAGRRDAWASIDLAILDLVAGLPVDAGLDGVAWASAAPAGAELAAVLHASPALGPAYYEARLEAPALQVVGCAPVGVPAFHLGRTRSLAWAGLPAIVDDCDVVLEEQDGIGNRRTPTGWEKLPSRLETIRVLDGAPVAIEVVETRRGPLVSHLARQLAGLAPDPRVPAIALHWGAGTGFSGVPAWLALSRARDVAEATRAAEAFERSTQPVRVVVADRAGRVATFAAGSVPVRDEGFGLPLLGWRGEGGWTGVRPACAGATQTSVAGPASFVAACGEVQLDASPPGVAGGRLSRIGEIRGGDGGARTEAPLDAVDPLLRALVPLLREAVSRVEDPAASELATVLASFDGEIRPEDRATAIVLAAVHHFLPSDLFPAAVFGPLASFPGLSAPVVAKVLLAPSSPWFEDGAARDRVVAAALARASAWLARAEATSVDRACGALFRRPAPLGAPSPVSAPGDEPSAPPPPCGSPGAVAMLDWRGPTPPFAIGLAPSLRAACTLGDARLRVAVSGGVSCEPAHPHSQDQAPGFLSGALHAIDLDAPAAGEILDLVAG